MTASERAGRMAATGAWLVVDEDGHGDTVRQAVSAQVPMIDVRDPFSARRILDAETIGGVIVVVGRRTLSLRAFCGHVRRERPGVAVVAIRHPDGPDDAALVGATTAVIDGGSTQEVTEQLASVSEAFEAGEATAILPPRLAPRPAPPPALEVPVSVGAPTFATPGASTSTSTPAVVVASPPPPMAMALPNATPFLAGATTAARAALVAPAAPASEHLPADEDEVTAVVASGPDLEPDATTETHVGGLVGSSVEEMRESLAGAGPELLVGIAARRRTGRLLVIDGEGAGIIHFLEGVPVGVELPTGDAGLYRRLVSSGILPPGTRPPIVRQGQLLEALTSAGLLDVDGRHRFERTMLGEQILAVSRQVMVRAVFVAVAVRRTAPVTAAPVTATPINVFGLIVEARRRSVAPEVIHALYDQIAGWQISGTALLIEARELIAPFTRGRNLFETARRMSARQLILSMDWDRTMGTLLLLALRSAGLVDIDERAATVPRGTNPMGISPRQLLGVGIAPDDDDIESAYIAHVERIETDLARTVDETERAQLTALRERLDVARQALRLQLGFATGTKSNPF